ncbi:AAA family ATPase [Bradyrhizobium sp. URHD0069]|uniref:AAA family ATPase n=1 Tax=Bradyrhizobium sp. URHD0069 TaxID=1380355 RepID=UPI000A92B29E|nr:AAA family ATPase [Bradyrhizobium sp. URHD0069]
MRLSQIEIENFKGIGNSQSVDLKPITLLFGPNSAGKSTILQSLHYLREILERRNADPDQTIAGGLIDLGGFATLVHSHDLNRAINLRVRIDLRDDQGSERLPLNSGGSLHDPDFSNLGIRYLVGENTALKEYAVVQDIGLGLEVRWSELIRAPYVAKATVEIDGETIAELHSPPQQGRAQLTAFNFKHPLLQPIIDPTNFIDPTDEPLVSDYAEDEAAYIGDPFSTPLGQEIWELSREMSADMAENKQVDFRVAVETVLGALPDLDRSLNLDLVDVDHDQMQLEHLRRPQDPDLLQTGQLSQMIDFERARRRSLTVLLDELILGPIRIVRDYLGAMTYIGPLREIPGRNYRPRLSPDETRWAQGLAAWDLLYTDTSGRLLGKVNAWLSEEERLRTGYRLEKFQFKEVPVPSRFHQLFERGLAEDDLGELQELYATLGGRSEIALRDFEKGIRVAPSDVGVGISQMIPVIVSCIREHQGILAIEQPELHVHPALQVGLGDLFIEAVQTPEGWVGTHKTLLIETHSEHIMLRLLRRIREATENELPPGTVGLSANDLSVIYVESIDGDVRFRPLRVDGEGEFLDRWPRGFFEERAEELF